MSNQPPTLDVPALMENLNQDLEHQLDLFSLGENERHAINSYLMSDIQSHRYFLINDAVTVGDLWKVIRGNTAITDLVTELTVSLAMHAESQLPGGRDLLHQVVAVSLATFNNATVDPALCALDDDEERERYVDAKQVEKLLASNAWLTTLFLLRRTKVVRNLIREVAYAANAARSKATGAKPPTPPAAT